MSFGFPAYRTETLTFETNDGVLLRESTLRAIEGLPWKIENTRGDVIELTTGVSIWSWGEKIEINFHADNTVIITSKCSLPTQCIDWGKNNSNVQKFREELVKYIR